MSPSPGMNDVKAVRRKRDLKSRSWSWLLKNAVLPLGDLAFGQRMMRRFRFLEQAQWWDVERLRAYRDRSLCSVIDVAYREVPFYRDLMIKHSVRPTDVRRKDDLFKLPVITKEMLRPGYPHLTTRVTGKKTYDVATSGSTGTNFFVKEDSETTGWHRASFLLALQWAHWEFGEPHVQTGMAPTRSLEKKLKDTLLRCYYISAFNLSDSQLDQTLNLLDSHRIQYLMGYPGSLYFLARRAQERGYNSPLRSVVTWGDNLYPHYRQLIEKSFKARVFDTYGCAEGMQISAQCGRGNTYHIHNLDVIVEFLDDEGNPVRQGQRGNIVLTRLHSGPMPLLRYRVGDVGVAGNGRRCDCGRGYEIMESIEGRDTDVVITPNGNRLIVHFFTGILEYFSEIEAFQVVQESIDNILILIVPTQQFSDETKERIVSALQEKGATGIGISVQLVDEIPLTAGGKRRFVISKAAIRHQPFDPATERLAE
jgi:phenylacetate-CoA ligase